MNRKQIMSMLHEVQSAESIGAVSAIVARHTTGETGTDWVKYSKRFVSTIGTSEPGFKVFAEAGNKKLPFLSFSSLPLFTCPGAGECAQFCYSLKAWRYPAALFRQLQNYALLKFNPALIYSEFVRVINKRKFKGREIDFRLYVDGDFANIGDVAFWYGALAQNQRVKAYGYTKSFNAILHAESIGIHAPDNYRVNLSSGHNADAETVARFSALDCVRGEFIAVNVPKHADKRMHSALVRDAARINHSRVFVCPGKCGECTPKGHACGSAAFKGITIAIAAH